MSYVTSQTNADHDRHAYWIQQMDAAYDFMSDISGYPVTECGEPLVSLHQAVEDAGVEVAFSEKKHVRGLSRLFFLREGLIPRFIGAAAEMNARGWIIKIEDAFRSREMQKYLSRADYTFDVILKKVIWELDGQIPSTQHLLKRITALIATTPKTGTHMSGSALDISVIARGTGKEIDRGGPYLELSELTPMDSPLISDEAQANRRAITNIMRSHGFVHYPYEFWHYSQGDAYDQYLNKSGRPGRYGPIDADLDTGSITPIANPSTPLNSQTEMEHQIEHALKRLEPRQA